MPEPPARLHVSTWQEAYDLFYTKLADGRTPVSFRSTLKNARDVFDGHLDSGRVGWREQNQGRDPQPLGLVPAGILRRWSLRSDDELWEAVLPFIVQANDSNNETAGGSSNDPRRRREHLLDGISRDHILEGFQLFNSGYIHGFKGSTKFDLLHEGAAYPPKAIIGLAGVPLYGTPLKPEDFTGGAGSKCFRVLSQHGFMVVPKPSEFRPTADDALLQALTRDALAAPYIPKPEGQQRPARLARMAFVHERDPLVRAFVLWRANGICESCHEDAPFEDEYGVPFLEVHHIEPLAEDGHDTVENAAAVCPNCHRRCHYGSDADAIRLRLLARNPLELYQQRQPSKRRSKRA